MSLIDRVRSRRKRPTTLFGEEIVVRTLPPDEAAQEIIEMQKKAAQYQKKAEEEGATPQTAEEIADKKMLEHMASLIADSIVEPELTSEERSQLRDEIQRLPLSDIQPIMMVFFTILGTGVESGPLQSQDGEVEEFFRKSGSNAQNAQVD